jgi:hypothetical protein
VQAKARLDDAGEIAFLFQGVRRGDEFIGPVVRPNESDIAAAGA